MKRILALALVLGTLGANVAPTSSLAWNAAARDGILTQIETALGDYFFVDRIPAIHVAIEAQRARLDAIADQETFAEETSAVLYGVSHDFSDKAKKMLDSAMDEVADTDGLIIDLRDNHGGEKATVDYFLGYFFGKRTQVTGIRERRGSAVVTEAAFAATELGGTPYHDKPVYVITSSETFSGAEQFAYDLQAAKRATIVGETTGGGANPGGVRQLNANFGLFVPTGSGLSPITNTNWEGVGVLPDTKTSAKDALVEAYTKALQEARNDASYAVGGRTEALQNPAKAIEESSIAPRS